jgi:hypothetical protein
MCMCVAFGLFLDKLYLFMSWIMILSHQYPRLYNTNLNVKWSVTEKQQNVA